MPGSEIPDEMVAALARAAASLGVRSLKFTGGEPLLRKDLAGLIDQMPPELKISLTTNGIYLADQAEDLAQAGLGRVNVSLDSLQPGPIGPSPGAGKETWRRLWRELMQLQQQDCSPSSSMWWY